MELEGVRRKVFEDRYAAKDKNGDLIERAPEEMWRRVAGYLAKAEKTLGQRESAEQDFYDALSDFKFVPGGRILSGAGSLGQKTFYNCFVIPSPDDSRGGIMESVTKMAEIMARGGGVGVNISSLRPKGSYVKGVNGKASGSVSFGGLYSYVTGLITQGGSRRGALMLMLNDNHPDIEEFITIKRSMGVITNANLSVCISDALMEAVKNDADWQLKWKGEVMKTIKAKYLWDLICESAWASGEPGIFFIDRANKNSNTWYFENLICTNPCVTGDTRVATSIGIKTMAELYEKQNAMVKIDSRLSDADSAAVSQIMQTGVKDVYKLKTAEGFELKLTADHRVRSDKGWTEAKNLKNGDKIFVLNRGGAFGKEGTAELGKILGWFVGDGHINHYDNRAILSFFGNEKKELAPCFNKAVSAVGSFAEVREINGRDESRIRSATLTPILQNAGVDIDNKLKVPSQVWSGTREMQQGFLQAIFTADGHTAGSTKKGVSVRLTSISQELLKEAQLLLLNFGIMSKIYAGRRDASLRNLPDGHGGYKTYFCQAQHDLVISKNALSVFAKEIGFLTSAKQQKLENYLSDYKKGPYHQEFVATFAGLEFLNQEMVYDLTEPATHSFAANGLIVHNCGEQPLSAWAVCNLGAINLSAFVEGGVLNWAMLGKTIKQAVRLMDNVIDSTEYFFPENADSQKQIRRIGLGTMGLADTLIKLKIRYGSEDAIKFCETLYAFIRDEAYRASVELAKERGSFGAFDKEKYLQGAFIQTLPQDIRDDIERHGIRNALLLTQAPTGSTGLLSGASSGIEPVYDFVLIRKDRLGEHEIYHPLYEEYKKAHPGETTPDYFVSAKDLTPEEHVRMQAVIQKYVDASISKTVNAPHSHTIEDVKRLYAIAHELGCKGMAYYRDGSRDMAVLQSKTVKQTDEPERPAMMPDDKQNPPIKLTPKPRPEVVSGSTYKIKTGYGTLFVTVNNDEDGKPFEVFAAIGKTGGFFAAKSEAICRLISLALRAGIDVEEIIEQLKGIRGPMPSWSKYGQVLSIPDAISHVLREHVNSAQQKLQLGFKEKTEEKALDESRIQELPAANMEHNVSQEMKMVNYAKTRVNIADRGLAPECPNCHGILELGEGCMLCRSCGYSKCS